MSAIFLCLVRNLIFRYLIYVWYLIMCTVKAPIYIIGYVFKYSERQVATSLPIWEYNKDTLKEHIVSYELDFNFKIKNIQHFIKIILFFSLFTTVGAASILSTINKEYRKFLNSLNIKTSPPLQRTTYIFTKSENVSKVKTTRKLFNNCKLFFNNAILTNLQSLGTLLI